LTPRAGSNELIAWDGDILRVRVAAPPAGGQANAALLRLLAKELRVPRSRLSLASGAGAREKTVGLNGMTHDEVRQRLTLAPNRS
jgi:uncharacterized protein YggU (UPF0235/DUF167 family)